MLKLQDPKNGEAGGVSQWALLCSECRVEMEVRGLSGRLEVCSVGCVPIKMGSSKSIELFI